MDPIGPAATPEMAVKISLIDVQSTSNQVRKTVTTCRITGAHSRSLAITTFPTSTKTAETLVMAGARWTANCRTTPVPTILTFDQASLASSILAASTAEKLIPSSSLSFLAAAIASAPPFISGMSSIPPLPKNLMASSARLAGSSMAPIFADSVSNCSAGLMRPMSAIEIPRLASLP